MNKMPLAARILIVIGFLLLVGFYVGMAYFVEPV